MCLLTLLNVLFSLCGLENMNQIRRCFLVPSVVILSWCLVTAIAVSVELQSFLHMLDIAEYICCSLVSLSSVSAFISYALLP